MKSVNVWICSLIILVVSYGQKDSFNGDMALASRNMDRMSNILIESDTDGHHTPPTEQQRIDTIKHALSQLPTSELDRLGVNIHQDFIAGSDAAKDLQRAWEIRQEELRAAVAGLMKPAEYMKDITNLLTNTSLHDPAVLKALVILESLLADIDNARDFHTIQGWPVLVSLLQADAPDSVKCAVALCVGTAVKNDYSYQLWTLESLSNTTNVSALELMTNTLHTAATSLKEGSGRRDLVKRLLYAISSAVRGNMDVQEAILAQTDESFMEALHIVAVSSLEETLKNSSFTDDSALQRKIWNLISDLLDEMVYLREGLLQEVSSAGNGATVEQIQAAIMNIRPLGEKFLPFPSTGGVDRRWIDMADNIIATLVPPCLNVDSGKDSFNESCSVLSSPTHRALYSSAVNARYLMHKLTTAADDIQTGIDDSIELLVSRLAQHSSLRDIHDE